MLFFQELAQLFLTLLSEVAGAAAEIGLRLEGAALFEVLPYPANGRHAVAQAFTDLFGGFALLVKLDDAFSNRNWDKLPCQSPPCALQRSRFARMALDQKWKSSKRYQGSDERAETRAGTTSARC